MALAMRSSGVKLWLLKFLLVCWHFPRQATALRTWARFLNENMQEATKKCTTSGASSLLVKLKNIVSLTGLLLLQGSPSRTDPTEWGGHFDDHHDVLQGLHLFVACFRHPERHFVCMDLATAAFDRPALYRGKSCSWYASGIKVDSLCKSFNFARVPTSSDITSLGKQANASNPCNMNRVQLRQLAWKSRGKGVSRPTSPAEPGEQALAEAAVPFFHPC